MKYVAALLSVLIGLTFVAIGRSEPHMIVRQHCYRHVSRDGFWIKMCVERITTGGRAYCYVYYKENAMGVLDNVGGQIPCRYQKKGF